MKYLEQIAISVIRLVSVIMLTILCVFSMFNTTFLKDIEEHSFFLDDNPLVHLVAVFFVIVLAIGMTSIVTKYRNVIKQELTTRMLGCSFLIGVGWILISQVESVGDSLAIFSVANDLHNGDLSEFGRGGYMYMCPNQEGIVLFCYFLQAIAGKNNFLLFQFLNVCALVISQWAIYKIVEFFTKNMKLAMAVLMAEICFVPAIIYTSFTYGTLLGFAGITLAVWNACRFIQTKNLRYVLFATIAMAFSIFFKSNNLICLIAMVLMGVVYACKNCNWKTILFPVLMVIGYLLISWGTDEILDNLTGDLARDNTFSAMAYIEMGLQESYMAPGWFNGYAYEVCSENNFDEAQYSTVINEDMRESLTYFANNPDYAYDFFSKKIISQWCEPTFQSMWIVLVRESLLEQTSIIRYWMVAPYSGANILVRQVLNIFQTIIYFGALMWVLRSRKSNIFSWIGMVMVIGGFLFHTMWEAKAQYALNYFLLLIPYSVVGLYYLAKSIVKLKDSEQRMLLLKGIKGDRKHLIEMGVFVTLMLIICGILICNGVSFANEEDILNYNLFMIYS